MDILPILSSLRRHKVTSLLVILEIALTCAIVCNAVFLISQRLDRMQIISGVAEHELVQIQIAGIGQQANPAARTQEDLVALRQVPGVTSVALTNQVPFTNGSWNTGVKLDPTQKQNTLSATQYFGENLLQTLGTQLVAGRYFNADDYLDFDEVVRNPDVSPSVVIITRDMGEKLWPGESALGKVLYMGDTPARVIGVVANLVRPSQFGSAASAHWSMVLPLRMTIANARQYVLRSAPEAREQVITGAIAALRKADPRRVVISKKTLDELRSEFFQDDRAMAGLLLGVIVALLLVTALGIVGLASFWVAQRRRTIGVRRALGATRRNILNYFQAENFLLATIGIALGMALAFGINLFLMLHYELPRLPAIYFPVGAIALWLIGQAAVLGPALRAAAVPPVVATRSV